MATQKFKFKLFTSSDPDAQYAAVETKDALTFYLLNNGKGYLGTTKLFDASNSGVTLVESIAADATGSITEAPSTKALVDYVASKVSASGVLTDKFFRAVKSHTITADDLTNTAISVPDGTQAGDIGLLFTSDNDSADGNEQYYFISLKNYLSTVHTFGNTDSITMSVDSSNNVTANLKIAPDETGLIIDANGVHLAKVGTINEDAPTSNLVTEDKMVSYVQNSVLPAVDSAVTEALKTTVTYEINDGTGSSGNSGETGGTDPTSNSNLEIYSTEETRIGTWIDGKPLYRKVFQTTTTSTTNESVSIMNNFCSENNVKYVFNIYGSIQTNDGFYFINSDTAAHSWQITMNISNGGISYYINNNVFVNQPLTFAVEYTKTTD